MAIPIRPMITRTARAVNVPAHTPLQESGQARQERFPLPATASRGRTPGSSILLAMYHLILNPSQVQLRVGADDDNTADSVPGAHLEVVSGQLSVVSQTGLLTDN